MRKTQLILLILLLSGGYYGYSFYQKNYTCNSVITYTLGTFDDEFGISKKTFLEDLNQASAIWEKAIEKNLFEYSENGAITVNLVYDTRQKTTEQNNILKADTEKLNASALSVKQQYTSLQNTYTSDERIYTNLVHQFEQEQTAYNAKVTYWNAHGGAPSDIYDALVQEHTSLQTTYTTLEQKRVALNTLVDSINTFIHTYNLLIDNANAKITTINKTAGKEFEEGTYDPNTKTITIYEFGTKEKLIRVLAHELGHALSLNHNDNPKSIMYMLNQSNTLTPSTEDIRDLRIRCNLL